MMAKAEPISTSTLKNSANGSVIKDPPKAVTRPAGASHESRQVRQAPS